MELRLRWSSVESTDFGMLMALQACCVYRMSERTFRAGPIYLLSLHVPCQQVRTLKRLPAAFNNTLKGRLCIMIRFMASKTLVSTKNGYRRLLNAILAMLCPSEDLTAS